MLDAAPPLAALALADAGRIAQVDRLGDSAFFYVAPGAIFLALAVWITMTLLTARKQPQRHFEGDPGLPARGPVKGGIIQGSPSQRVRRDPAPSVTDRQVAEHIEAARERERRSRRR